MNLSNFDRNLWRFNGVIIALCCLGIGLMMACGLYGMIKSFGGHSTPYTPVRQTKIGDKPLPKYDLALNSFQPIPGTQILVGNLSNHARYSPSSMFSSSYSEGSTWARNCLFYDCATGESYWLKPDNNTSFSRQETIYENPDVHDGKQKAIGFIFTTMPYLPPDEESNAGERKRNIAFYGLAERHLKEVASNIKSLLSCRQMPGGKVAILYSNDDDYFVLTINAKTGERMSMKQLPTSP